MQADETCMLYTTVVDNDHHVCKIQCPLFFHQAGLLAMFLHAILEP